MMFVLLERVDVEDMLETQEWVGRVNTVDFGWKFCLLKGNLRAATLEKLMQAATTDEYGNLESTITLNTYRWSVVMQPIRRKGGKS